MQKRMKLTNTTEWTFLGIGERMTTKVVFAIIVTSQYTPRKGGRLRAALAWSFVLFCRVKMVMIESALLFRYSV